MKILVVSECFYPDVYAINDTVRILCERGHQVTVLTGLPDYTTSLIPEEYRHGKNRKQELFHAKVIRVPTIARRKGPVFRALSYLSFAFSGSIKALFHAWEEFDVIYVWEVSPVTMAIPAIVLKKRYRKPLFLYCMDIWPECVKAMNFREGTIFYKIIAFLSRKIYQSCDRIAVSSRPFIDYLKEIDQVDEEKISYLPQYADDSILEMDLHKQEDNHHDFLYVGNMGKAQDLSCLVKAAARLKDREDLTFHMVGNGSEYEHIVSLVKELGAEKLFRFYGSVPFDEALAYYKKADACILTLVGSSRIGDTLPGKLQTYMAAGKMVIAAINGAGNEVIEESGCGLCCKAGDDASFSEIIEGYINNINRYKDCGEKGRSYFRTHFSEKIHFTQLEKILEEMTKP